MVVVMITKEETKGEAEEEEEEEQAMRRSKWEVAEQDGSGGDVGGCGSIEFQSLNLLGLGPIRNASPSTLRP
jgi:hypothetical protein